MNFSFITETPLVIAANATRTCWDSFNRSDSDSECNILGPEDAKLILRVGKKFKHYSVLAHLNIFFKINIDESVNNPSINQEQKKIIEFIKTNKYSFYDESSKICVINARTLVQNKEVLGDLILDLYTDSEIIQLLIDKKTIDIEGNKYYFYESGVITNSKGDKVEEVDGTVILFGSAGMFPIEKKIDDLLQEYFNGGER